MTQADSTLTQQREPSLQQAMPERDVGELGNAIEMALCHVSELIGLAHEIACEMHGGMACAAAILHVSGRLATLMHSAAKEVEEAQQAARALSRKACR